MGRIEVDELSTRSFYSLRHRGITAWEELADRTESDLLATQNFGRKSLREVKRQLAFRGMKLKGTPAPVPFCQHCGGPIKPGER